MNIRFLGTGAAEGIPSFGCSCDRCLLARREGGANVRKRASLLVEMGGFNLLLDTPPEISLLLNQAGIFSLEAVLLSHEHFDHIGGLTEFEYWNQVLPVFMGPEILPQLRLTPRLERLALLSTFLPQVKLHFGPLTIMPFRVVHHVPCYGFMFEAGGGRVVHFTDAGPELSAFHRHLAEKADLVIFHTPTFEIHPHHISVRQAIALVQEWSLSRVVITHINHHNLPHDTLVEKVESHNITVAFDGLTLEL